MQSLSRKRYCSKQSKRIQTESDKLQVNYPAPKNVTINGIDYLESTAPIGKFGGELVSSTIGEGPKTFNPFNCKDNTSQTMASIMYDGLLTSDPITGQPTPKLAKSFSISPNGKTYTIKLRCGIKWSDGKPITADDVVLRGTISFLQVWAIPQPEILL